MLDKLDLKIRRMHEALGGLEDADLTNLKPELFETQDAFYCELNFSQNQTEASLANTAGTLIANIASLKDHLKLWCNKNKRDFKGDELIDTNRDVAIVHDLWNIDKHAELDRKPRSGHTPRIENLRQSLNLSTGGVAGSSAMFSMDPRTGEMRSQTTGGAKITLSISGEVVSENGKALGDFATICETASDSWKRTLIAAGISIPALRSEFRSPPE